MRLFLVRHAHKDTHSVNHLTPPTTAQIKPHEAVWGCVWEALGQSWRLVWIWYEADLVLVWGLSLALV